MNTPPLAVRDARNHAMACARLFGITVRMNPTVSKRAMSTNAIALTANEPEMKPINGRIFIMLEEQFVKVVRKRPVKILA
jgi:hypothetical protein